MQIFYYILYLHLFPFYNSPRTSLALPQRSLYIAVSFLFQNTKHNKADKDKAMNEMENALLSIFPSFLHHQFISSVIAVSFASFLHQFFYPNIFYIVVFCLFSSQHPFSLLSSSSFFVTFISLILFHIYFFLFLFQFLLQHF